jgi:hypothetical protein
LDDRNCGEVMLFPFRERLSERLRSPFVYQFVYFLPMNRSKSTPTIRQLATTYLLGERNKMLARSIRPCPTLQQSSHREQHQDQLQDRPTWIILVG